MSPQYTVNFGPLTAEICWRVWGTAANFNAFRVLVALLYGTLVLGVSQTVRLWQRAPPIFGMGAITLGIGPHSSFDWVTALSVSHSQLIVLWHYIFVMCLYFHAWCGLSANLECRSEMCCTQLAGNTGRKNDAKNRHLRTTAQICRAVSSQPRHDILTVFLLRFYTLYTIQNVFVKLTLI